MVFYSVRQVGIPSFTSAVRTHSVIHLDTTVAFQSRKLITHILLVPRHVNVGGPGLVTVMTPQQSCKPLALAEISAGSWCFGFCLCIRMESHDFSVY
jgi:hypothetical protein